MKYTEIARRRLFAGHLLGEPLASPEAAVAWFGALQSQDYAGAAWALGMRTPGLTATSFDRLYDDGALIRTHVMRPTWHFVHPSDVRWLLDLTGPRVQRLSAGRYRQLELDDRTRRRAADVMAESLADGAFKTRRELADVLERKKIATDGQRMAHLTGHAELEQKICSGPRRGKQFTYATFDERVPPAGVRSRDDALADLVHRYFSSHGPATFRDFAWWSGLTVADAKRGLAANGAGLEHVDVEGRTFVFSPEASAGKARSPVVHLLPNYDESVASFASYEPTSERIAEIAGARDALMRHIVTIDGQVVGGWKRTLRAAEVDVETRLLIDLDDRATRALDRAATGFARFLEVSRGSLDLA